LYIWKNHPACKSHKYGAILYLGCQIISWNDLVNVSRSSGFCPTLNKFKCVRHILVPNYKIKFNKIRPLVQEMLNADSQRDRRDKASRCLSQTVIPQRLIRAYCKSGMSFLKSLMCKCVISIDAERPTEHPSLHINYKVVSFLLQWHSTRILQSSTSFVHMNVGTPVPIGLKTDGMDCWTLATRGWGGLQWKVVTEGISAFQRLARFTGPYPARKTQSCDVIYAKRTNQI
jgi:hypothetical protein